MNVDKNTTMEELGEAIALFNHRDKTFTALYADGSFEWFVVSFDKKRYATNASKYASYYKAWGQFVTCIKEDLPN